MIRYVLPVLLTLACGIVTAEDSRILQIRQHYNAIENARLDRRTIKWDDDPFPVELTRHDRGDETVKLVLNTSSDHGSVMEYFYFRDGKLFFVFSEGSWWQFTGETDAAGNSKTVEGMRQIRYYFHEGKCIRALRKEVTDPDFDKLAGLIAARENEAFSDPEAAAEMKRRGEFLFQVLDRPGLERYLQR